MHGPQQIGAFTGEGRNSAYRERPGAGRLLSVDCSDAERPGDDRTIARRSAMEGSVNGRVVAGQVEKKA